MTGYLYKLPIPANRKALKVCTLCNKLEDEFHVFENAFVTIPVENYISNHIMLENQAWLN